jgi:carbonic anhydrase/acetyltransferase-like protein (isoleucine patch superfamily)
VVRGDQSSIYIGGYSSVGDRTVIQSAAINPTGFSARTYIGDYVTIGQGCILRACTVDDNSVVGDGCIIQEGALVDRNAMLEAGSLLPSGARVPSGEVYGGSPATFVRKLSKAELTEFQMTAEETYVLATQHADEFLPYGTEYQLKETMEAAKAKA